MKFQIKKNELVRMLKKLSCIVRRVNLPILNCVLLKVEGEKITLTASNLESRLSLEAQADVGGYGGGACIPIQKFLGVVEQISVENIEISITQGVAEVVGGNILAKIQTLPESEFPSAPSDEETGAGFLMQCNQFNDCLCLTISAMGAETHRAFLNGVHFCSKDGVLHFESSNGYIIHAKNTGVAVNENLDAVLPAAAALLAKSVFSDTKREMKFSFSARSVCMSSEGVLLKSQLSEHLYPDISGIIPMQTDRAIEVEREDIIHALESSQAIMFLNAGVPLTRIVSSIDGIKISSGEEMRDFIETDIPSAQKHSFEFCVRPDYLLTSIKTFKSQTLKIEQLDKASPLVIRDGDFLAVINILRTK